MGQKIRFIWPKLFMAIGVIVILAGCIVGYHAPKTIIASNQLYSSLALIFGGYIISFISTMFDARYLEEFK